MDNGGTEPDDAVQVNRAGCGRKKILSWTHRRGWTDAGPAPPGEQERPGPAYDGALLLGRDDLEGHSRVDLGVDLD